jgi:hypothetical protein
MDMQERVLTTVKYESVDQNDSYYLKHAGASFQRCPASTLLGMLFRAVVAVQCTLAGRCGSTIALTGITS